jgi:cold shock CspA family protein
MPRAFEAGTVKFWMPQKGCGFIQRADGGPDLFFHVRRWQRAQEPRGGEHVTFVEGLDSRGRCEAQNVRPA